MGMQGTALSAPKATLVAVKTPILCTVATAVVMGPEAASVDSSSEASLTPEQPAHTAGPTPSRGSLIMFDPAISTIKGLPPKTAAPMVMLICRGR